MNEREALWICISDVESSSMKELPWHVPCGGGAVADRSTDWGGDILESESEGMDP